jgi:hypothetical protein
VSGLKEIAEELLDQESEHPADDARDRRPDTDAAPEVSRDCLRWRSRRLVGPMSSVTSGSTVAT